MNWITVAVVGAVALWFEYSYRRSRRKKSEADAAATAEQTSAAQVRVANPGSEPSIGPGDENDKRMNAAV